MKLKTYRNLWGCPRPWDTAVATIQDSGYDGIEAVLFSKADHAELRRVLRRVRMPFKGTVFAFGVGPTVEEQLLAFNRQLKDLARTGASSINVVGGYDCWLAAEADRYFEGALRASAPFGLPISFETHRNSALFHPAVTARILRRFPEIRLTCDFSHWVVACERLIDDQLDLIRLCGAHADHLHVRVGTLQAPQVADIRAPEAAPFVQSFERWWDIVWEEQRASGLQITTLCPEFGPPPYLPTLPYSGEPVADLAEICDWQRERQVKRFKAWTSRKGPAQTRR